MADPRDTKSSAVSNLNVIIRASAGTGKTFQLSSRFLILLSGGAAADHILATTFTRKAAGEILDRVLLRLATAALEPAECRKLATFLDTPNLNCDQCRSLLGSLMRNLHRLRVSTLDSFFAQIAHSFSLELGLPPGWRIAEELEDANLRTEAIGNVLAQESPRDALTLMNLLTKGETVRSISELIRSTVKDLYGVFQETQRPAWTSLPRRKGLTEHELNETLEQLRTYELTGRESKARDENYLLARDGQWADFLDKGFAARVLDGTCTYYKKAIPEELVRIYRRLLDHAQAELVGLVALQTEATYDLLDRFHSAYELLKHERRLLRFEDITRQVARRMQPLIEPVGDSLSGAPPATDPNTPPLAFRLDGRIDHLLLDEFQDTAAIQWRAVRPFAVRAVAREGQSFFCVGDVKQAIYGWRGGDSEIFDAVAQQLGGLQEQVLNQSFRSAPPVIDTVNRVFRGMIDHPNLGRAESAVRLWQERFQPHATAKTDLAGHVRLETAAESDDKAAMVIDLAARRVQEIVRAAPGHSVAVLVRRNEMVARMIHRLRQLQVPASEEGGNPLTDSAAVLLVLSLLQLADHPGDRVARFHLAHSPLGPPLGIVCHLDDAAAIRGALLVRGQLSDQGYGAVIFGWRELLRTHCSQRELSRLDQLVELAFDFQPRATLRPGDFVRFAETQRVSDPTSANVRVMTIHQAKGLQFDVVVLPELDAPLVGQLSSFAVHRPTPTSDIDRVCRNARESVRKLFPGPIQKMFDDDVDRTANESLCVLYVALTRAIHAMYMIVAPSHRGEKGPPQTYAGVLRVALRDDTPALPQTCLYEHGNPAWYESTRTTRGPSWSELPAAARPAVRLAPPGDRRQRGWERTSPSLLEGGARVKLSSLFDRSGEPARLRGTLIHALFEQIEWLDRHRPETDRLRQVAAEILRGNSTLDAGRLVAEFERMLSWPAVARVLQQESYPLPEHGAGLGQLELVVRNEFPIAFRADSRLISGNIDRLVLLSSGGAPVAADIIDFKTDLFPANDMQARQEKTEFYRPQIDAYRQSIATMFRISPERITARLVFVGAGEVQDL